MAVDSTVIEYLARSSWRARPSSFVALMSLYESNYLRVGWLAGDLQTLRGRLVSRVSTDCDLILNVVEQTPYTTAINLTYSFPVAEQQQLLPDMTVRVYHDARLAEAQSWAGQHEHAMLRLWRSRAERELDQRWARNMMLNKWLEYCVDRGHRFQPGAVSIA